MAVKRQGVELVYSINGVQINDDLKQIDKGLRNTRSEALALKKSLDEKWDVSKAKRAQELLQRAVDGTKKKVDMLKQAYDEIKQKGVTDENRAEFEKLSKDIAWAENAVKRAQKELANLNNMRLNKLAKEVDDIANKFESAGKKLTLGITAPIVAAGAASYKMASDLQEALNKVEVSFGASSDNIKNWSESTLETYGLARVTALDMAAYFGDMATSMGFAHKEAADMSKTLVGLVGDIASFKNISTDQALTAVSAIFTGETESIKRLGIVMTQANLEAFALAQGINKSFKEMSQAEQVALRYQYVLDKSKNSQGDFARTIDDAANQMRILQESVKELGATFGEDLAPIITPVIQNLNELIQKFASLDDGQRKTVVTLAIAAAAFGPMLTVTGKLTHSIGLLVTALAAKRAADTAATASQTALNTALAAAGGPVGVLITVIGTLAAVVGSLAIANTLTAEKTYDAVKAFEDAKKAIDDKVISDNAELDIVEKLIPRYDELNKKTNKTSAEKEELRQIVETINRIIPDTIKLIDEEAGRYDALASSIRKTVEARREEIRAIANQNLAIKAQQDLSKKMEERGGLTAEQARKKIAELQKEIKKREEAREKRPGSGGMAIIDYDTPIEKELKELQEYLKDIESLQKRVDYYLKSVSTDANAVYAKPSYWNPEAIPTHGGTTPSAPAAKKKSIDDVEYEYAMGRMSLTKYIAELTKYRNATFKKDSAEYREYSVKIKRLTDQLTAEQKRKLDEQLRAEEKAAKDREQAAKDAESARQKEYSDKLKALDQNRKLLELQGKTTVETEKQYLEQRRKLQSEYLSSGTLEWQAEQLAILEIEKNINDARAKELSDARQKEYSDKLKSLEQERKLLELQGQSSIETEKQYLEQRQKLQEKYLKENTAEWRDEQIAILEIQNSIAQKQKSLLEEQAKEYQRFTDEVTKMAEEEANAKIKAIDDEIAARDRLIASQKLQKQLEQAQAKLKYETDRENKEQLEKEIRRLKDDIAEQNYRQQMEAQKDLIASQIEEMRRTASALVSEYNRVVNPASATGNVYNNSTMQNEFHFAQSGLTPAQTEAMIKRVFQDIMRNV